MIEREGYSDLQTGYFLELRLFFLTGPVFDELFFFCELRLVNRV